MATIEEKPTLAKSNSDTFVDGTIKVKYFELALNIMTQSMSGKVWFDYDFNTLW